MAGDGLTPDDHDLLRGRVRERAGRREEPSAVAMHSQTVHAAAGVPAETIGLDPGKKSRGRQRGIATDVLGLVVAVVVTAASVHDNAIGIDLLDRVAIDNPSVRTAWVDAGFKNAVADHGQTLGITVQTVRRDPGVRGFAPIPKRWVAEQTFGTLMPHRRLVRDYEKTTASSQAHLYWACTDRMTRRLTGATARWRAQTATEPAPTEPAVLSA